MNWPPIPSDLALATGAIVAALLSIRYEIRGARRALERIADRSRSRVE